MPPKKSPVKPRSVGRPKNPNKVELVRVTFWLLPETREAWEHYVGRHTLPGEHRNATTVFKRLFDAALAAEKKLPDSR